LTFSVIVTAHHIAFTGSPVRSAVRANLYMFPLLSVLGSHRWLPSVLPTPIASIRPVGRTV